MIIEDFSRLLNTVTYWLSYQEKAGRQFMIEESSIRYPVADYLSGLGVRLNDIHLEYPHPILSRRHIDLVITNATGDVIQSAVEFKIAKVETKRQAEQKRVFYDLIRLYIVAQFFEAKGYFMMLGRQTEFVQNFRSIQPKPPLGLTQRTVCGRMAPSASPPQDS